MTLYLSYVSHEMEDLGWSFEAEVSFDVFGIMLTIRFVHDETGEMGEIIYSTDIDQTDREYRLTREIDEDEWVPEWKAIEDSISDVLKVFFEERSWNGK